MSKIILPKKPHRGLKIFCKECRLDNPSCNHHDMKQYRARIHIPGTLNGVRTKVLRATNYEDAVIECIQFEKELKANNYETVTRKVDEGNDYSVVDAILKFNQYLNGESGYAHLRKEVTDGHREEMIRFCKLFAKTLKKSHNIERMRITEVSQKDVSDFYIWASGHYSAKTFNKCMAGVRYFFEFLIRVEEVEMKNPFREYERKKVPIPEIKTITREEFDLILDAVDTCDPICQLGGKGEKKNLYRPYLKDGFRLFLLCGGRREEIVSLKWNEIYETHNKVKFFKVLNLKVSRMLETPVYKYFPINDDLWDLLIEMGYEEKKGTDEYLLHPERYENYRTMMDILSKAFTHFRKGAGIKKEIQLKHLRKTYISWVNVELGENTGLVTSSTNGVLENHYIDPKILTQIELVALKVKVFGNNQN